METMAEKKLYEGMFLVDSARAASDWDGVNAAIKRILDRAEAEITSIRKWDDRRLAYSIRGTSRGTYILCYFKAEGRNIQGIEKAVQLSDNIIRVLILNTDQMTKEDIEKDTPATKAEKDKEKAIAEKPLQAEVSEQDDQQEEPAAEQAQASDETLTTWQARTTDEAQVAEDVEPSGQIEQAEETEASEEIRKAENTGQTEEAEAEEPRDNRPEAPSKD